MWPYAYSSASGEWFFIDVSSEHWCLTFATGQWSTLGSSTSDSAYAPYERDTHQRINAFRQSRGLPPLIWDDTVADVCREHSQNMADGRVPFSHDGFDGRTDLLFGTFSSARSAAENVAYNQGYPNPPATAVSGWIDSPGHYENIVGNWTHTGIGVARNENNAYYFTQIFLRID